MDATQSRRSSTQQRGFNLEPENDELWTLISYKHWWYKVNFWWVCPSTCVIAFLRISKQHLGLRRGSAGRTKAADTLTVLQLTVRAWKLSSSLGVQQGLREAEFPQGEQPKPQGAIPKSFSLCGCVLIRILEKTNPHFVSPWESLVQTVLQLLSDRTHFNWFITGDEIGKQF